MPHRSPAEQRCAALLLAAGASSRLGQPKQLLRIAGESLLHRTARLAAEAGFAPVYTVVGALTTALREELNHIATDLPVIQVENPAWHTGMGSSVAAGVRAAIAHSAPAHLLLLVCDQPQLTTALLLGMRKQHLAAPAPITAAQYGGRLGVPALFGEAYFPELLRLTGDRGARALLQEHAADVLAVPFPGGAADIDTREDLAHLPGYSPGDDPVCEITTSADDEGP